MALMKCKECGKMISNKAASCPICGAPVKKKRKNIGCGTYILCIFLGIFIIGIFEGKKSSDKHSQHKKPTKTPQQIAAEEAACKKDLQCWGDKHSISARVYCDSYIEKLAKYSHKWTDGMLESKFSHFRWNNQEKGYITFIGDKIKFQNGFGAWQNYVYECDFNPADKAILDVRAKPGRL